VQIPQNRNRTIDRASDHLVLSGAERVDQLHLVGVLGREQPGALGKAAAGIVVAVPFVGAHGGKKMLHPRFVAGEQLAVEMPRVPVDQHAAEVEHDDIAPRLRHPAYPVLVLLQYHNKQGFPVAIAASRG
jgi:hypothetical protein